MIKYAEVAIEADSKAEAKPARVVNAEVHIEAQGMAGIEAAKGAGQIVITGGTMEEVMAQIEKLIKEGKLVRKE